MEHVSEDNPWRGRGAPSLGTLEDMLRKSLDTGISLHGVLFPSKGNLLFRGVFIPGTLIDE